MLIIDGGIATLQVAVETHAELVLRTEAPAQIQMPTDLRIRGIGAGEPGQVFIQRTLGHDVDHAADAAVRRDAVHQRTRPLEHFNALGVVGEHPIIRRDTVDAVERQLTKVAFANREATDEKRVDDTTSLPGRAH
ncbi:hypothetical protein D3C72_520300 [compost metagenome]